MGQTRPVFHTVTRPAFRATALLCAFGTLVACTSDSDATTTSEPSTASSPATDAPADDAPATEVASTEAAPTPDDATPGEITVVDNPSNLLSARLDFELAEPATIQVTAVSGDHIVEVPPTAEAGTSTTIPLVGMRSERTYSISATLSDTDGAEIGVLDAEFTTGSIPERFLPFEFESDPERASAGYTIIEMQELQDPASATPSRPFDEFQYLLALDNEGEIVWYYEKGPVIASVEQTSDGTFSSIYWPHGVREFDMLGTEVGEWTAPLSDAGLADLENTLGDASPDVVASRGADAVDAVLLESDLFEKTHHEVQKLDNGNFLVLSATAHELTDEQRAALCPGDEAPFNVLSDVAVEFAPDGEVLRTWDLWDVIDVDEIPGEEMCNTFFAVDGARDWTHANAVIYDADRDAVIFSARHTSQVVAMRHGDELGAQTELLWTFGDNGTIPLVGDGPRYQHAVEVQDDGSILLYDNGNGRPGTDPTDPDNPPYSRAVLYDVDDSSDDPADWQVTQLWEHRTNDADGQPLYASFIGDADRLTNGNVLITHGGTDFMVPDSYLHSRIIEVVPDGTAGGDIVWQFDAGQPGAFASTYRAERIDSFYVGSDWATAD